MKDYVLSGAGDLIPVRKIAHGEKVTEPGVYDMPMLWYHADCCDGPSISSSGLRKINSHSPAHYWDTSPLNPKRNEEADEELENLEAIRLGRAVHTLVLEPQFYAANFVTRPAEFDSWRTKASQEWRAAAQKAGKTVVDGAETIRVARMAQALKDHPLAMSLLDGDIERALIWRDHRTGVWLKARPDAIPRGTNILADLKCLRDVRTDPLRRAIFDTSGYDQQLALVGVGMDVLLGRKVEEHVLVAVESKAPCSVTVRPIAPDDIGRALIYLRRSINRFLECWEQEAWPSFEQDDNTHVQRLPWQIKDFERQVELGLLPSEF